MTEGQIVTMGWIDEALRLQLLPDTEVIKRMHGHLLIAHDSIPWLADHVTIRDGAYVVIPNPDDPRAAIAQTPGQPSAATNNKDQSDGRN